MDCWEKKRLTAAKLIRQLRDAGKLSQLRLLANQAANGIWDIEERTGKPEDLTDDEVTLKGLIARLFMRK